LAKLTLPVPTRCIKALLAIVPPLLLPPLFDKEEDIHSMHADSSPTTSAHAVCRALKARASLVWPLPAGPAGSKDSKGDGRDNDGNAGGGGQELDHALDWDGPSLPPPDVSRLQMYPTNVLFGVPNQGQMLDV
jgi:hypothetical protein